MPPSVLPVIHLVRHGETAWSRAGRHTGRTDLPLTAGGETAARALGARLAGLQVGLVLASPLVRARRTCELAGFAAASVADGDLVEWNYGDYEGKTTAEILRERPGWKLFRDGCPQGEAPGAVAARADRVIARARAHGGDAILFSSAHFLRMLAARWIGLPPEGGADFMLGTASLSALGYEHDASEPVIRLWNDTRHVPPAAKVDARP